MAFSFREKCWEYWYLILVAKLLDTGEKTLYVFKDKFYSFEEENGFHFSVCVSTCWPNLWISKTNKKLPDKSKMQLSASINNIVS